MRRVLRGLAIVVASLVALVVVAVAIFAAVFDVHLGRGIGDRTYVVTTAQELRDEYRLGIGSLELDLSELQLPPGETHVETSVDVGDLRVIVPPGVALRATARRRSGNVDILGTEDDGRNADVDVAETGERVLVLDAHVGAGNGPRRARRTMTRMSLRTFASSSDERVIAGVCAGIAQTLGVDATLVRLVFALLALAGGAGILLYLALWAWADGRRAWVAAVLALVAGAACSARSGSPTGRSSGSRSIAAGLALAWRQGGSFQPDAPLSYGGLALAALGAVVLLSGGGTSSTLLAPGRVAGALLLIGGPWVWRLALERDVERTARIRSEERSDMAARVHDSVLQTLALIQQHAHEPRRVASLARRQERELRGWLYGDQPLGDDSASLDRGALGGGGRRRGAPRRPRRARERRRLPGRPPWARSCSRRARR